MVPVGAVVDQVDASAASLARESGRGSDAGALEAGDELDDEPSGRRRRRGKQVMAAPAEGSRCIGETTLVTGTHPCRARDPRQPGKRPCSGCRTGGMASPPGSRFRLGAPAPTAPVKPPRRLLPGSLEQGLNTDIEGHREIEEP